MLALITALGVTAGCVDSPDRALRPVHAPQRTGMQRRVPDATTSTATAPAPSTTTPHGEPASRSGPPVTTDERVAVVDDVLVRYDRTLTAVLRHPADALRDGDPTYAAWSATVAPGAVLADDIRSVVTGRAGAGETVEPPRGGGLSYVHRAVAIDAGSTPGSYDVIPFTWCGWSPGVVRDVTTGAVTDDAVSHTTGTGTLRRVGQTWLLGSLDETTVDILPAGSPDPCPAVGS